MAQPKIKIKWDRVDWTIEVINGLLVLLLLLLPLYYISDLPDTIPTHFNAVGEADGFSEKSMLWLLPAIGLFLYTSLTVLNKFPHLFNYPTTITSKNAEGLYLKATKLVRVLNMICVATFLFISVSIVHSALGHQNGLGYFLPVFLFVTSVIMGFYFLSTKRK